MPEENNRPVECGSTDFFYREHSFTRSGCIGTGRYPASRTAVKRRTDSCC